MQKGAFAFIDCLGFKGIWDRYPPEEVINKLVHVNELIDEMISEENPAFEVQKLGLIKPSIRILSDTVAISFKPAQDIPETEDDLEIKGNTVAALCTAVTKVLDYFIDGSPPLLLRGCITYGEHITQQNFLIGPAVDEAAMKMDLPNGAFVWLTPRAEELYDYCLKHREEHINNVTDEEIRAVTGNNEDLFQKFKLAVCLQNKVGAPPAIIKDYEMPIKNGERLICPVINPLGGLLSDKRKEVIQIYLNEMKSEKLDVTLKRQHTKKFLEVANKACEKYEQLLETYVVANPGQFINKNSNLESDN